ncbi:MAG: 50S ribosomal protein L18 [Chlamydiia bacterium]|nr:50S ribosomal protein L18 [Chlamydiia bacterium]MCP5509295.1 50S ribosomal protein L18 [Chlamydiales bacterium]
MHSEVKQRVIKKQKRTLRVRKHLRGTAEKPRLCVFKSNAHISVQLIDDDKGITLVGLGSYTKEIRSANQGKPKKELAANIGHMIGAKIKEHNIGQIVFDRGPNKYHGVIAALADAVREAGIKF